MIAFENKRGCIAEWIVHSCIMSISSVENFTNLFRKACKRRFGKVEWLCKRLVSSFEAELNGVLFDALSKEVNHCYTYICMVCRQHLLSHRAVFSYNCWHNVYRMTITNVSAPWWKIFDPIKVILIDDFDRGGWVYFCNQGVFGQFLLLECDENWRNFSWK